MADFQIIQDWEKTSELRRPGGDPDAAGEQFGVGEDRCAARAVRGPEVPAVRALLHYGDVPASGASDIVIVNHHLFFADLALKEDDFAGILPDYHAVIFDEAHEIEDIAGQYFGVQVSNYRFQELRRDMAVMSRMRNFGSAELDRVLERLEDHAAQFFAKLPHVEGRTSFPGRRQFLEEHRERYEDTAGIARAAAIAAEADQRPAGRDQSFDPASE